MRRALLSLLAVAGFAVFETEGAPLAQPPPNIVIVFTDDMGYGDIGVQGHPTLRTPHLDRMAAEGQRWTSFYTGAPVCTPSRAALLTGRLPVRNGMVPHLDGPRVLFPDSDGGLPSDEITIAELLKKKGYATACIGKWHLGHRPQYLPTKQGFDLYYGIPYSNDMDFTGLGEKQAADRAPRIELFNVPLMKNESIIERPAHQATLTRRYTEEALRFIAAHRAEPFFIYLAHSMPHVPLFASTEFQGKSARGLYGDVIEEIDWSTGRILDSLKTLGLADRTLVVFTSDNGPWLVYEDQGGSSGLLRGGKGGTFEGGMRVPGLFWWPGKIKPAVIADLGSTLDLLPTTARLAGIEPPSDRVLDGYDLTPALLGTGPSPRKSVFFYRDDTLFAVRSGAFKAHFFTKSEYGSDPVVQHEPPLLYQLDHDPSEVMDVSKAHPDQVLEIRRLAEEHRQGVKAVPSQLESRSGKTTSAPAP